MICIVMSHYQKQECGELEDEDLVCKALEDMKIKVERGTDLTVKNAWDSKNNISIKIPRNSGAGNHYEAGFAKNTNGKLELVKDGMDGALNKDFVNRLKQHYQKRKAMKLARAKGLTLQSQKMVGKKVQLVYSV